MVGRVIWSILIMIHTSQSTAAVFGTDDRIPVSAEQGSMFSPVGVVYPPSKAHYATGFLVGRCHVLTVKHVVGDNKAAENGELFFSVGPRPLKGKWTSKGTVVANGKFKKSDTSRNPGQGRERDWLLLRLDRCLGSEFGYVRFGKRPLRIGERVESVGFPRDRSMAGPTLDPSCTLRAWVGSTVLHDCASRQGSSGGPIFRRVRTDTVQQIEVVAMHSAGVPDQGVRSFDYAYSSISIPIRDVLPSIKPYLDSES